ncbi:MAG: hypothetical protein RI964_2760 [Pseudomonadota bacterium]
MQRLLLLSCVLCLTAIANADDAMSNPMLDKSGKVYGGISVSSTDADCSYGPANCQGNGWKVLSGYKFNPNAGVEGAYQRFFHNTKTTDANVITLENTGMSLAAVGFYPVNPKTEVFGKAGFMTWEANAYVDGDYAATARDTDLLLGVGAGYQLDDNWGIRGEYERVGGNLKADTYSVGTTFSTF